jgi:hypothetical protein
MDIKISPSFFLYPSLTRATEAKRYTAATQKTRTKRKDKRKDTNDNLTVFQAPEYTL